MESEYRAEQFKKLKFKRTHKTLEINRRQIKPVPDTTIEKSGKKYSGILQQSCKKKPFDLQLHDQPKQSKNNETHIGETMHLQMLRQAIGICNMFGAPVGAKICFDWKPNALFCYGSSYLAFTWTQFFYSQYLHVVNGELLRLFEVFALYGIALSVLWKVIFYVKHVKRLSTLFESSFKLCRKNVLGNRAKVLKNRMTINYEVCKLFTIVYFLAVAVFVAYPIKTFVTKHELVSLLPLEIIFTDQSTIKGYLVANFVMAKMGIYSMFPNGFFDVCLILAILNYAAQIDIMEEDIRALDDMWSGQSETTLEYRHSFLRNICRKRFDMDNYVDQVKKVFDSYIFIFFCSSYVSQIICLFEIVANHWIPGYGVAYAMFVEMMFYCIMGSKLTSENERLCHILQQSKWYTYDQHTQKEYQLLLHSCMNAKELWIGHLAPLSVFTGTEIIKSIYTYFTILKEIM